MKKLFAVSVAIAALTACGSSAKNATTSYNSNVENRRPAGLIVMPGSFPNIASKCDRGVRVYESTEGAVAAVIDSACRDE